MESGPHCPPYAYAPSVAVMAQRTSFATSSLVDPRIEPVSQARKADPLGRSGQGFWGITSGEPRHLRVLIANEPQDRRACLAEIVSDLGHTVIPRNIDTEGVGALAQRAQPDVALVDLASHTPRALALIEEIVHHGACPVVAILTEPMLRYVREAARCGAFAYSLGTTPEELQSAIDISLHRFADYHSLQGAFQRRAIIEQAKGILMARHALDPDGAFALLRNHSQNSGRKLVDIATLIVDSHLLLPQSFAPTPTSSRLPDTGAEVPSAPYAGTRT
jgi:AmiR/NasT family two-component response regulator